jgi:hypothetical protein
LEKCAGAAAQGRARDAFLNETHFHNLLGRDTFWGSLKSFLVDRVCVRNAAQNMKSALMFLPAMVAISACSDATGSLQGGTMLPLPDAGIGMASSGSSSGGDAGGPTPTPTWTYLYGTYFGITNVQYGCGSTGMICHQASTDTGVVSPPKSGFVCGTTSQECYQGMMNATPPLVTTSKPKDPTTTPLYQALCKTGATVSLVANDMPLGCGYTFTSADLALITTWISDGAPNN